MLESLMRRTQKFLLLAFLSLSTASVLRAQTPPPPPAPVSSSQLNQLLGLELFTDETLWDDDAEALAKRLNWPQESKTDSTSSFRLYPTEPLTVLGNPSYSLALQAEQNKPTQISIVFTNKGDFQGAYKLEQTIETGQGRLTRAQLRDLEDQYKKIQKDFPKELDKTAADLEQSLTKLLGPAQHDRFGKSGTTKEKVLRWDWGTQALLLSVQENEYVSLRIVPTEFADNGGKVDRMTKPEFLKLLQSRVTKRDNGDVLITQIPMVDQGPKGYCVPATWERCLRYSGIPADMYVLAMAGGTDFGGGTNTAAIAGAVDSLLRSYGRKLDSAGSSLESRNLSKSIDEGFPIMWTMFVDFDLNKALTARSAQRQKVTDWTAWKESLKPARAASRSIRPDKEKGHMCMIIGYNATTGEIAISDSWGPEFAERWITTEEAEAITQGKLSVIQ